MDERLRQALRRFRETNSKEEELIYLRELYRAQQITDERLKKAAYFGNHAANEIAPYDTPYRIARLMNSSPPEPPITSWFCDNIYQEQDLHDTADIWCQVDLIGSDDRDFNETGYEIALFVNLLMLYYIISRQQEFAWYGPANAYNEMRQAILTSTWWPPYDWPPNNFSSFVGQETTLASELLQVIWNLVRNYIGDSTVSVDIPMDLRWVSEELLQTATSAQRREMCDFVANRLQQYLLGYIDIAELLPRLPTKAS